MDSADLDALVLEANAILADHGYVGPAVSRAHARAMYMAMQQLGIGASAPQRTITRRVMHEETIQEPITLGSVFSRLLGRGE